MCHSSILKYGRDYLPWESEYASNTKYASIESHSSKKKKKGGGGREENGQISIDGELSACILHCSELHFFPLLRFSRKRLLLVDQFLPAWEKMATGEMALLGEAWSYCLVASSHLIAVSVFLLPCALEPVEINGIMDTWAGKVECLACCGLKNVSYISITGSLQYQRFYLITRGFPESQRGLAFWLVVSQAKVSIAIYAKMKFLREDGQVNFQSGFDGGIVDPQREKEIPSLMSGVAHSTYSPIHNLVDQILHY